MLKARGGTGGRSVKGFFFLPERTSLSSYRSFRLRHFLSEEKKERAEPSAALMAARRNMAGISGEISHTGMMGVGLASVAWLSLSRAVSASLFLRERKPSCAWIQSKEKATTRLKSA